MDLSYCLGGAVVVVVWFNDIVDKDAFPLSFLSLSNPPGDAETVETTEEDFPCSWLHFRAVGILVWLSED